LKFRITYPVYLFGNGIAKGSSRNKRAGGDGKGMIYNFFVEINQKNVSKSIFFRFFLMSRI